MFYSQTFLARKGPLGTVWCAAHLQHRLRKSHYTSTDIVSTVDRIMFPEVPIALRMSGHLLLGVVRIYSKKVEYLIHDCNVMLVGLRKAFSSNEINLPENATTAKPESVTLPQVLDLDALDLDDIDVFPEGSPDNHLRRQEEITLADQFPIGGGDQYIAITFDEDIMMDTSLPAQDHSADVRPMEEDIIPGVARDDAGASCDPGTSNQTEVLTEPLDTQDHGASDHTELLVETQELKDSGLSDQTERLDPMVLGDDSPPEIEIMRDAVYDSGLGNLPPLSQDHRSDASVPIRSAEPLLNQKEILSPIMEETLPSGGQSLPSDQHTKPMDSVASRDALDILDTNLSFENTSPGFAIRSSPPAQELAIRPSPTVRPPQRRQLKRKQLFDEAPVLKNKFMKSLLENTKDLVGRYRPLPSSSLYLWKLNKKLRKEQILFEPSLTGMSNDICNLSKKDYISAKPHLTVEQDVILDTMATTTHTSVNEDIPDTADASSPAAMPEVMPETRTGTSPAPVTETTADPTVAQSPLAYTDFDREIERLRHVESHGGNDFLPDLLPLPPRIHSPTRTPSTSKTDNFTPALTEPIGPQTVDHTTTTTGTEVLTTQDIAASAGTSNFELETPRMFSDDRFDIDYRLSDIPEMNTADAEDLYFLEADNTPPGSQGTQGVDALSVRTRAVVQYLKRQSPSAPLAEDPSEGLSLNQILQERRRKLCARMFYETLVLTSYGLIDVQQDQPYGDITLKLTAAISKIQI